MISAKQNICRGLLFAVFYLLAGCGGWIPSHKATMNEVYPPANTLAQFLTDAPQGSVREKIFQAPYNEVYDVVEKSLTESEFRIHTTSKPSGIILVTYERLLEPPPDLLNCPNNHFSNSKPQKWTYYIAIVIAEKNPVQLFSGWWLKLKAGVLKVVAVFMAMTPVQIMSRSTGLWDMKAPTNSFPNS